MGTCAGKDGQYRGLAVGWLASTMQTKQVSVAELTPYEKNPRSNDSAVDAVARSIEAFGFRQPIVVDEHGVVIVGHTRLKAAIKLGLEKVPVHVAEGLTPEQVRAYRIADNATADLATWDMELLPTELQELKALDVDLGVLGFGDDKLAEMMGCGDGLTDPDEVPESPAEAITKPGDLIVLGEHRLLCGDATSQADTSKVLDGETPNLMVTDPPYGVNYDPRWRDTMEGGFGKIPARAGGIANDDIVDWSDAWKLFFGAVAYVWHAGKHTGPVQAQIERAGFDVRSQIIWSKQHFAMSRGDYHWKHEPCLYAVRKGHKSTWVGDRKQTTVWDIASLNPAGRKEERVSHGTQKPVECMLRPIRNHKGDVYDPFLGSGTTIIACEQLGRRCFGLEIDPLYCDVIVSRWEKFTGKKAERHRD